MCKENKLVCKETCSAAVKETLVLMVNCWCGEILLVHRLGDTWFSFDSSVLNLCWCAEKTLMLIKIETLALMEFTLVLMVNCWCAEVVLVRESGDMFFFRENIMQHWCCGNCSVAHRKHRFCLKLKHWCQWKKRCCQW